MKKKYAIVLFLLIFASCSVKKKINFLEDNFVFIGDISHNKVDLISILKDAPFFIFFSEKNKSILGKNLLFKNSKWEDYKKFDIYNTYIEKIEKNKKQRIVPKLIKDIMFQDNYMVYTMKLGSSPNSTVGVYDLKLNKQIFSIPVENIPENIKLRIAIIGLKEIYFSPKLSNDKKNLVVECYTYDNKNKIKIINLETKKSFYIENAVKPIIINDKIYYIYIDKKLKKGYLAFSYLDKLKIKKIYELKEFIRYIDVINKKIFYASHDKIFMCDITNNKEKIFYDKFNTLLKNYKKYEIRGLYTTKDNKSNYLFVILKILNKNNKYSWKIYGMKIK